MSRLDKVSRHGQGWLARCPAHADGSPSLSIRVSDTGNILLKCFAGCPTRDVVDAVGMRMTDLAPEARANLSPCDLKKLRASNALKREEETRKEREQHLQGAIRARATYEKAIPCETHPYLSRKNVSACPGLRVGLNGNLLVPMETIDGDIWNLTRIPPGDGRKEVESGCTTKGLMFWILGDCVDLRIAEGIATGLSLNKHTDSTVVVCFGAQNMERVGLLLREAFPDRPLIISADNDSHDPQNPGLRVGKAVADLIDAELEYPPALPGQKVDFNDFLDGGDA